MRPYMRTTYGNHVFPSQFGFVKGFLSRNVFNL